MLQIIVFSILVGVAITQAGKAGQGILSVFQDFNDVIMRMVTILMHLARKIFLGFGKLGSWFRDPGTRIRREKRLGLKKLREVPGSSRRFREALGFPSKTEKNLAEKQKHKKNNPNK